MTKFNVGDRVRLLTLGTWTDGFQQGGEYFISNESDDGEYRISKYARGCVDERTTDDYAYVKPSQIEPVSIRKGRTNISRLTEAEAKIAALEAEVETMKCQIYSLEKNKADTPTLYINGRASDSLYIRPEAKTPNQRRADVIKRAQAFVADLEERASSLSPVEYGNTLSKTATTVKFFVNSEKGVVTALAFSVWSGKLLDKAFAKCHPNDVFNADIGKAIAAGKLYGVDIPQEFVDAPKPTEIVVGMRVKAVGSMPMWGNGVVERLEHSTLGSSGHRVMDGTWNFDKDAEIVDDTNAVYS